MKIGETRKDLLLKKILHYRHIPYQQEKTNIIINRHFLSNSYNEKEVSIIDEIRHDLTADWETGNFIKTHIFKTFALFEFSTCSEEPEGE